MPDTSAFQNMRGIQGSITAMRASGQKDEQIVQRLINSPATPAAVKAGFLKAQADKKQGLALSEFLAYSPGAIATPDSLQQDYSKAAPLPLKIATALTGGEKVGRRIASGLAETFNIGGTRDNLDAAAKTGTITPEERTMMAHNGVTNTQLAGDALQVGLTAAAPFAAKGMSILAPTAEAAKGLTTAQRVLSPVLKSAAFGTLQAGAAETAAGGSASDVLKSAAFGGTVGGAIPLAGRALGIVGEAIDGSGKKIYDQLYGKTAREVIGEGYATANGTPQKVTVGEWALNKGVKGSAQDQVGQLIQIKNEAGKAINNAAVASKGTIKISDPKLIKTMVTDIAAQASKNYDTAASKAGIQLIATIDRNGGELTATQGLRLRQYLDAARTSASFNVDPSLTGKQPALKAAADGLRKKLATSFPELASSLSEYSYSTEALSAMLKKAVRDGNKPLIGLYDALAASGAIASFHPVGAVAGVVGDLGLRASRSVRAGSAVARTLRGLTSVKNGLADTALPGNLGTVGRNLNQGVQTVGRSLISHAPTLLQ